MASPTLSTTVLGKRDTDTLVLHLSGSEEEQPPRKKLARSHSFPKQPLVINGRVASGGTHKRYRCTFGDCDKAYSKPCRLEEHERSHTGLRPFVCTECQKSYLRETHLQAHARSHLSQSSRPLVCTQTGCEKRFWTSQHLRAHENLHLGEKPFKCTEPSCEDAFSKHHQLRTHVATEHSPPGTKSHQCSHENCNKSFATNQKLRAHAKTHDDKRYICAHTDCHRSEDDPTFFPTWSALQQHNRIAHPPTCPHSSCNMKVFTTQRGLGAHMKLHEDRELGVALRGIFQNDNSIIDEVAQLVVGEVGKNWVCEVNGCTKAFKSKRSLNNHNLITHLGQRDFVCPYMDRGCERAFGYKKLLDKHVAKAHGRVDEQLVRYHSSPATTKDPMESLSHIRYATRDLTTPVLDITAIAGVSSSTIATGKLRNLSCPYPNLPEQLSGALVPTSCGTASQCGFFFTRSYDLRRHLRAVHGIGLEKETLDAWVKSQRVPATL